MLPEKEQKATHEGHRKRCKSRVLDEGSKKLTDVELLEMLLFYAIPRVDTRKQAELLIERYGTLDGVITADPADLSKYAGIKENAEVFFALLREMAARVSIRAHHETLLEGINLKRYLIDLYKDAIAETVYALYFDSEGKFLGKQFIFRGGLNSARFSLRTITEGVFRVGGKSVILAHNHPSGVLIPSGEDILSTKRIAAHLSANEINLIDHFIVGKDDCVGIFETMSE